MAQETSTGAAGYTTLSLHRRLLRQARPYWRHIAVILLLDLLAIPLPLLKPLPLKIAVDSVLGSAPIPHFLAAFLPDLATRSALTLLAFAASLQVVIVLLVYLQELGAYALRTYTGESMTLSFRARLLHHAQRLSLSFHDSRGTADSIYRIQHDAPSIQSITMYGVIPVISAGLTLVAMFYVVARINWQLALVALAVSPFIFVFAHTYDRRMRGRYIGVKELESTTLKAVQEILSALRVVKAFGREDTEEKRFVAQARASLRARVRLSFAEGGIILLVNLTIAVGMALVLFIGIRAVQSGSMTLGDLLMVIAYLSQLYGPLETISSQTANLESALASARRAFELLDKVPEVAERVDARPLECAEGAVEFRNVSFAYDPGNVILNNVSFSVRPRTRLGVVGRTGAGKTTLVNLLTRFHDPTSGQILLDGVDLRDYKLADLRNQFAVVLQEPFLFSTSIAENIAYGRPTAKTEEIVQAALAANAHDFIAHLPEGYEAQVGERGMRLSGGERQRISLARAFLKDAPILILDEPTSSVDTKTEVGILEAMERLMRGRTAFIIAHRPSTLKNCDALLVLEDGRLVTVTSDVSMVIGDQLGPDDAVTRDVIADGS